MGWQRQTLFFEVKSGLHIGAQTLGFIKRTRWFIPSKILWAMTTRVITEFLFPNNSSQHYELIGDEVDKQIRFTNFYLWTENHAKGYTPEFTDKGLLWGGLKPCEFAQNFIGTQTSTALSMASTSAEENMLHEVEYILPFSRSRQQVYLVGEIFYKENLEIKGKTISNILDTIFLESYLYLGGESAYGYGRVIYNSEPPETHSQWKFTAIAALEEKENKLCCRFQNDQYLPCFVKVSPCNTNTEFAGDVELLVAREIDQKRGYGQSIKSHNFCWIPGTKVTSKSEEKPIFSIEEKGFWNLIA